MRQFGEGIAVALLFSHPQISAFDLFAKNPDQYPTHKALDTVNQIKNRRLLEINPGVWESFTEAISLYNESSHASAYITATHVTLGPPHRFILGAGYDAPRKAFYEGCIREQLISCEALSYFVEHTLRMLLKHCAHPAVAREQ
jgi:hypothetical protein